MKRPLLIFAILFLYPVSARSEDQKCCVDGNSIITTVAGSGLVGYSGDNGPATLATFSKTRVGTKPLFWENSLSGIWVDSQDNLYIADGWNNVIRKVTPEGIISTWAGTGQPGFSGDGGPANQAQLFKPTHVTQDGAGNFFICDEGNNRIRKVDHQGIMTTIAGNGKTDYLGDGGPATLASLNNPYGVAADREGNVYIADTQNHAIRKVSSSGIITTISGDGKADSNGDDGPAISAEINSPECVVVDPEGNLYFNDDGAARNVKPSGRLRKIDRKGIITRVAGTDGTFSYGYEGPALEAQIDDLHGIAFCGGNIYISDVLGNRIRMIDPEGIIHTIAGDGMKRNLGDGGPAKLASVHQPDGLAFDRHGNLYIAENPEHVIRKIIGACGPVSHKTPAENLIHPSFITPSVTPTPTVTRTPTASPTIVIKMKRMTLTFTPTLPPMVKPEASLVSPTPMVKKKRFKRPWTTPTPRISGQPNEETATPTPRRHRVLITATPTETGTLRSRRRFPTWTPAATIVVTQAVKFTATPRITSAVASPIVSMAAPETISYTDAPANIYLTFEDGPGRYELEIFDAQGRHLKTAFSEQVVGQNNDWANWDGKNEQDEIMPVGHYFAIFYKNRTILKKIAVVRIPME